MLFRQNRPVYFPAVPAQRAAFSARLASGLRARESSRGRIVFVCIGTDRVAGDCLGPLVGTLLRARGFPLPVFGALNRPLHAGNLSTVLPLLHRSYPHSLFVAVDAAVGRANRVGMAALSEGPLFPGEGVGRNLAPVGQLGITGVVAENTAKAPRALSAVAFCEVARLAQFIADGIAGGIGL